MINLIFLNILAVTTVSFLRQWLQENESTRNVKVCVQIDPEASIDFNVTVQTQSGTAHGER